MKKTLICVFILLNSISAYCQRPHIQDLQSEAKITFPGAPDIKFSGGASYYIYRNTSNELYLAQVTDLNEINPDSLGLSEPDGIYRRFINATIYPMKGEVFYREKIKVNGRQGVEFDYKCRLKGNRYYGYQQVFHLEEALVSYSFLSPDSLLRDDKKIKSFFNTFKLTPTKAADLNKKSGIMAIILIIGSITFWGALATYLIKRSQKKKRYQWPDGQ